jgi:3-phytase
MVRSSRLFVVGLVVVAAGVSSWAVGAAHADNPPVMDGVAQRSLAGSPQDAPAEPSPGSAEVGETGEAAGPSAVEVARVKQVWASQGLDYKDTDSLTACRLADGSVRVFATAKKGDWIDEFDAVTGKFVARHGLSGTLPGLFKYPNGIATVRFTAVGGKLEPAILLVVERDNARVQAFRADDWKLLGEFGHGELKKPYGVATIQVGGVVRAYITDDGAESDQAVKVYELHLDGEKIDARRIKAFGAKTGPGVILERESVVVDERQGRILLCDEDPKAHDVKVYTLNGRFTGQTFGKGIAKGDPEGIVVVDCPNGGAVILTDQQDDVTTWHFFTRDDYQHLGSFTGTPQVANTDGICVFAEPFGPFAKGAMFAVNDDSDVRAYDLKEILELVCKVKPDAAE